MADYYREDVYIKFNTEIDEWELIDTETKTVIDSGRSVVCLVNNNNCLR